MLDIRQFLRDQTRTEHQQVDDLFRHSNLQQHEDYSRFLACHAVALTALAPHWRLDRLVDVARLQTMLDADLAALGRKPAGPMAVARFSQTEQLGAAYVLAGSHFGKKILCRIWAESTDDRVLAAGRFMQSDHLCQAWPRVMAALGQSPKADRAGLCSGAKRMFGLFKAGYHAPE